MSSPARLGRECELVKLSIYIAVPQCNEERKMNAETKRAEGLKMIQRKPRIAEMKL